jgi:hypothetical protein
MRMRMRTRTTSSQTTTKRWCQIRWKARTSWNHLEQATLTSCALNCVFHVIVTVRYVPNQARSFHTVFVGTHVAVVTPYTHVGRRRDTSHAIVAVVAVFSIALRRHHVVWGGGGGACCRS